MAFVDFIQENPNDRERGVFMHARKAPRGQAITFEVYIGNKVLDQLKDEQGRSWRDAGVQKLVVRIGTGEDSGQMLIAALASGNISLKTRDTENPSGRRFSVKNFPGVNPMKRQEVKWQLSETAHGVVLHVTEYSTETVADSDLRTSEAGGMGTKSVVKTAPVAEEPAAEEKQVQVQTRNKVDISAASQAYSKVGKR